VGGSELEELRAFLTEVDLTLAGLEARTVRLWVERDADHKIVGSTGYEISEDRRDALIRSVAVSPQSRKVGSGSCLARFALSEAAREGAQNAWLFSRRSGPFWEKPGFVSADREQLASLLADTHQVQLFISTGQLSREVAWSKSLTASVALTVPRAVQEHCVNVRRPTRARSTSDFR